MDTLCVLQLGAGTPPACSVVTPARPPTVPTQLVEGLLELQGVSRDPWAGMPDRGRGSISFLFCFYLVLLFGLSSVCGPVSLPSMTLPGPEPVRAGPVPWRGEFLSWPRHNIPRAENLLVGTHQVKYILWSESGTLEQAARGCPLWTGGHLPEKGGLAIDLWATVLTCACKRHGCGA